MSSILGGGGQDVVNQTASTGGLSGLLTRLGEFGQTFTADQNTEELLGQFIRDILSSNPSPDIEPNPTPLGETEVVTSNLGRVDDRILTPLAGTSPSSVLGPIQDRIFPRQGTNPFVLPPSGGLPGSGLLDLVSGGRAGGASLNLPFLLRNIGR